MGVFPFLLVVVIHFFIGFVCWTWSINEWLRHYHKQRRFPRVAGGIMGLIPGLGPTAAVVAVAITWVAGLFWDEYQQAE